MISNKYFFIIKNILFLQEMNYGEKYYFNEILNEILNEIIYLSVFIII